MNLREGRMSAELMADLAKSSQFCFLQDTDHFQVGLTHVWDVWSA